jgi:hypothetical protein
MTDTNSSRLTWIPVLGDEPLRFEAHRDVAHLVPFAMHSKVQHAFALLEIAHAKLAEFLAAQSVIQERGKNCPVAFAFECVFGRCIEEHPRLFVTECRGEAFIRVCHFRPLHAFDRIMHDRVALAEIFEE